MASRITFPALGQFYAVSKSRREKLRRLTESPRSIISELLWLSGP